MTRLNCLLAIQKPPHTTGQLNRRSNNQRVKLNKNHPFTMDESEQQLLHENTHEDQRTLWQPEPQNQISALYLTPLNGPMNALTM
jgi:hypothetical protein